MPYARPRGRDIALVDLVFAESAVVNHMLPQFTHTGLCILNERTEQLGQPLLPKPRSEAATDNLPSMSVDSKGVVHRKRVVLVVARNSEKESTKKIQEKLLTRRWGLWYGRTNSLNWGGTPRAGKPCKRLGSKEVAAPSLELTGEGVIVLCDRFCLLWSCLSS